MSISKEIEVAQELAQELAIEKMAREAVEELAGEVTDEHKRLIGDFAEDAVQKSKGTTLCPVEHASSCLSWNFPDKQKQREWSLDLQIQTLLR